MSAMHKDRMGEMTKPDGVNVGVWSALTDRAAKALDALPTSGLQTRESRIESIALALLAEREACAQIADNGRYTTFMAWDIEGSDPVTSPIPYREEIAVAIRNQDFQP